jgi:hypothetical protein
MQPWQLAFLGQHELPRELTAFELCYFFSFNDWVFGPNRRKSALAIGGCVEPENLLGRQLLA